MSDEGDMLKKLLTATAEQTAMMQREFIGINDSLKGLNDRLSGIDAKLVMHDKRFANIEARIKAIEEYIAIKH